VDKCKLGHFKTGVLGFTTGARFGELTALTWDDLDLEARTVHYTKGHYYGHVGTTKTNRYCKVPLVDSVVEVMREHREDLIKAQHPGVGSNLVFPARIRAYKVDQIAISAMMDHSTEEMTSHYSFVDLEEKRSHVLRLVEELS